MGYFDKPVTDLHLHLDAISKKSIGVLHESQFTSGGTAASLKGTRYAGNVYPRDHAYATQAFIALHDKQRAQKALDFILSCPLSSDSILFQRYNQQGENTSYKEPQIDGNAQTLLSVSLFAKTFGSLPCEEKILKKLLKGIENNTLEFEKGDLVKTINGIIEFSPFEKGFDLYTNAVTCKALIEIGSVLSAKGLVEKGEKIKNGIFHYLYFPIHSSYMTCVRMEPDASVVTAANLKSFLSLIDYDIFSVDDPRIQLSLEYHLKGTKNEELGGYNRYGIEIGRNNFGNGPWPMVMLRLASAYHKMSDKTNFEKTLSWIVNVALENEDPYALPEHVSTRKEFEYEYELFKIVDLTSPRPKKQEEYEAIRQSANYIKNHMAYSINPLVWSHAQFILLWTEVQRVI
jgi:GH15 family glucan-1,4-alpha-glucosidase